MNLIWVASLLLSNAAVAEPTRDMVGQPADIASSAYQYRADRRADANPPESWIALMHAAHLPLNQPVDRNSPAIKAVLCGFLWEEIRPVQTLELTWPAKAKRQPPASAIRVIALINQGASSSWWNNLTSVDQTTNPTISTNGRTYSYAFGQDTCGLVVSLAGGFDASKFDIPRARVLVPDTWKSMNLEIEWGFDATRSGKDYSGHIEAYDGRISNLKPLNEDSKSTTTDPISWKSHRKTENRRGIKFSLLYIGISKWRKQQQYTSQPDDVARTIVTVWTKSGNFSFLAADLENGPIFAPEYGFFVRRTSTLPPPVGNLIRVTPVPLSTEMNSIAGSETLKGWGTDETPWFGSNPSNQQVAPLGVTMPAKAVAMHPGQFVDVVAGWKSPIRGKVKLEGRVIHAQAGGNGIEWWVTQDTPKGRNIHGYGATQGTGSRVFPVLGNFDVQQGDSLCLIVGPKGDHRCDTTIIDWTITEVGGLGRIWNLAKDVGNDPQAGNPHADSLGNAAVWQFSFERPMFRAPGIPANPPIELGSTASSAKAFLAELAAKNRKTIREQTRDHAEETWRDAVTETRGPNLPDFPVPPAGAEPPMTVQVPSKELTEQWNLGAWHLLRHCGTNPKNGKHWFNDYPYGILAAETYMVLAVLDLMGAHQAAADGFDQWVSLPLDRNPPGTDASHLLPSHPVGLFSEGHGSLTYAEGPAGYGGHMDGIHAFGPGSIGWALTQHYWMTGDIDWLKASAPRIKANAEWMLRQRQVLADSLPGGNRLWCKGLQPALQVTPDSGGLWMQFYECEAYYWASVSRLAATLSVVDPVAGASLKAKAESYRGDLQKAVERSIALSPVEPVRDGTYHSVIPFACYVRGLSTGAWGWRREGSGSHVGPLYWDTVQSAAALISPAGLLPADDVRVQGYLDVLEDRLLLENQNVGNRNWFFAGWQYQGGLERTPNMHLASDDIPVFLRSFFNCYAVDILPNNGYVFNEHAVHGPPDKIFEEAAFLERFRNILVMEDGPNLWLARATPRAWLEQGQRITVKHAPTQYGEVSYEIVSDVSNQRITAKVQIPSRNVPNQIWLRLRHPMTTPMTRVTVNGKPWKDFDPAKEVVKLYGIRGSANVEVRY